MFLQFTDEKERILYGGSAFLELQYCNAKQGTSVKNLCAVSNIRHGANDSLYIYDDDMEVFYSAYAPLLGEAFYNNGRCGKIDIGGINYFSPQAAALAAKRIAAEKPIEHEIFLTWIQKAVNRNGFYLLGL